MDEPRKPWLFVKRLKTWNPLAAVRPMLAPMAPGEQGEGSTEPHVLKTAP